MNENKYEHVYNSLQHATKDNSKKSLFFIIWLHQVFLMIHQNSLPSPWATILMHHTTTDQLSLEKIQEKAPKMDFKTSTGLC